MEKLVELIGRYHYRDGYFVEVSRENPFSVTRDYWLCKRGSVSKLYMFSSDYKGDAAEERLVLRYIEENIQKYEQKMIPNSLMA